MQDRIAPAEWNWDDLRLFLAVMRCRTLTGAAKSLGVNQSTASRRLAGLESALGVALFDRSRDGLEPTSSAVDVLALAESAEDAVHGFAHAIAARDTALLGTVRLAVPDAMDSLLIVPELPAFYERFPRIRLEVVGSPALANLARREADLALRLVRPSAGDVVVRRIARMTSSVWARDPGPCRWVTGDEGEGAPDEIAWTQRHVPAEAVVLRVNRMEARLAAVQAGLGRAVLPDAAAARVTGIARVETVEPPPPSDLWMVAHRRLFGVSRVRAVWDFLAQVVPERLGGA